MRREYRTATYFSVRRRRAHRELRRSGALERRLGARRLATITARWAAGAIAGMALMASLHADTLISAGSDQSAHFLIYALHVGELLGEPELDTREAACQAAAAAKLRRTGAGPRLIPVRVVF